MTSTPPETRPRLPRGQRRALLLTAARSAFAERGYHATAMDDIAALAGVSKPVLYQHFDSKLDLYLAVARLVSVEVVGVVQDALTSTDDNEGRIVAGLASFFAEVARPDSGYSLLITSDLLREPAVAAVIEDTRRACGEAIGSVIADRTDLPWDEAVLLGTTLAGTAQTAAQHWHDHRATLSRERALALVTGLVWRGLGGVPTRGGETSAPVPG